MPRQRYCMSIPTGFEHTRTASIPGIELSSLTAGHFRHSAGIAGSCSPGFNPLIANSAFGFLSPQNCTHLGHDAFGPLSSGWKGTAVKRKRSQGAHEPYEHTSAFQVLRTEHMRAICNPQFRHLSFCASGAAVKALVATRALVQALANTVTSNDDLQSQLWSTYMNLPDEENILM